MDSKIIKIIKNKKTNGFKQSVIEEKSTESCVQWQVQLSSHWKLTGKDTKKGGKCWICILKE